jgi:hydrogenase maturation protease
MKILLIGLGNPILGDDGVGWVVAHEVEKHLVGKEKNIEVDCLTIGGLSLMERMIGYKHVILVDSLNTGQRKQGSVIVFSLDEMINLTYGHSSAAHDASLKQSLEVGRSLNAILPADGDVHVVAIEAEHVYEFMEELSKDIAGAVPVAVQMVLDLIAQIERIINQ